MRFALILNAICLLLILAAGPALAAAPHNVNYQGYLTDDSGYPVTGSLDMTFTLHTTETGANDVWTETWNSGTAQIIVTDGYYSANLGQWTQIGSLFETYGDLWLEVIVEGESLTPRKKVASAAFALESLNADTLDGSDSSDFYKKTDSVDADTLDSMDSTAFASASHSHSFSEITGTIADSQVPDNITINYAAAAGSVPWSGITSMPGGFSDGTDDVGLTTETDPEVGSNTANQVPYWDGSALVSGNITDLSGDIGIGETAPQAKLHVAGDVKIEGILEAQGTGTPIESLPLTITSAGYYYLAGNLTSNGTTAITIDTDNVTIDLNGYTLSGTGAVAEDGFWFNYQTNIEIRNGTITGFGRNGIYSISSEDVRVINIRANNNGIFSVNDGIYFNGGTGLVKDCSASNNAWTGINGGVTAKMIVINCTSNNNVEDGIAVGDGSLVKDSIAHDNGGDGIDADEACTIVNNTVHDNAEDGISARDGSTVIGNTSYKNGNDGIYTRNGCTVVNNTSRYNTHSGFVISAYNLVKQNTSSFNQRSGFQFSSDCLVTDNVAAYNNRSSGSYSNFEGCITCTYGTNHDGPL